MKRNYNFPWYMQHDIEFTTLLDELFKIVSLASPLGIGDAFNVDKMSGNALFRLGILWGLNGSPQYYDGLIYKVDNWSEDKTWSGQMRDIEGKIYKAFVKMHAYGAGRNYTLGLIKDAIAILMEGKEYVLTVDEGFMSFTINISGKASDLRLLQEMQTYDSHFLGKPSGISYKFNYITTGA